MEDKFAKILAEECGGEPSDYTVDGDILEKDILEYRADDIDMSKDNLSVSFDDLDIESADTIN